MILYVDMRTKTTIQLALLDALSDGVYAIDSSGVINYANAALAGILGYENAGALIGKDFSQFIVPEYRAEISAMFRHLLRTGSYPEKFIAPVQRSEGQKIWLEIHPGKMPLSSDPQTFVGTIHDITKLKDSQIAEEANRSLHQLIVERSPDAIAILTRDGVIETANSQALELFGFKNPEEIVGQHVMNLVSRDELARGRRDIKRLVVRGELQDSEHNLVKADGTTFWAEVSGRKLPAVAGAREGFFVLVRDISKRRMLESSLRNLSITDDLTGLYNRRGFTLAAEQELRHARRTKSGIVFLFFDMDRLKAINDRFGHAEGDHALIQAADLLRSSFRNSDILGRWGGDEFAVLALDVPLGYVDNLHKRLDDNISKRNNLEETPYLITFSSGMVRFDPDDPMTLQDMEKMADEMMYFQKSSKNLTEDKK